MIQLPIIILKRRETSKVILIVVILLMVLFCIVVSDINIKVKVGCVIVFGAFIVQAVVVVVHPKVTTVTYDNILKYEDSTISYVNEDNEVLLVSEECMRVNVYIDDVCRLDEVTKQFGVFKIISYVFYVPEDVYKSGKY